MTEPNNVINIAPYQLRKGRKIYICPKCGKALDPKIFGNVTRVICDYILKNHIPVSYTEPGLPPTPSLPPNGGMDGA